MTYIPPAEPIVKKEAIAYIVSAELQYEMAPCCIASSPERTTMTERR